jgi:hypothetical protein
MQDTSSSGEGEKGARVEGDEALGERRCGNCGENTVRSCLKDNRAMIYSYNFESCKYSHPVGKASTAPSLLNPPPRQAQTTFSGRTTALLC